MLSSAIRTALSQEDFDTVEADWLGHLGDEPEDLAYFLEVSKSLRAQGQEDLARVLVELLDEALKERQAWSVRLALLRETGTLLFEPAQLHSTTLDTLRQEYSAKPHLEELMTVVGLFRGTPGEPKMWQKVDRLVTLLSFDVGAIVTMEGKGVGQVVELNLALEGFKIDFEQYSGVTVGFRAAGKLLKPLSPSHILRRKLEEPSVLEKIRDSDPAELLRLTLTSYDHPLTGAQVREVLRGVVPEKRWTSWWAATRKHPQVVSGGGTRQSYRWVDSTAGAKDALWENFQKADPRGRLEALRRSAERDPELHQKMAAALAAQGQAIAHKDPGLAFEVWSVLEGVDAVSDHLTWDPEEWLAGVRDICGAMAAIRTRSLKEKAYALLQQVRDDWSALYREALLAEEDPRLLDRVSEVLRETSPPDYQKFITQALSQPRKSPGAFTWLAERAAEVEELRHNREYRLFQQILMALGNQAFQGLRSRLLALWDSGGTVPRLLPHFTEDQATEAYELIERTVNLEPYQKDPLRTALELRFPGLRSVEETPFYATAATLDSKRAELKELLEVEIPANRRAIEEARALGDLRENFEYKSARQRHEYLAARAAELNRTLTRATALDPASIDPSEIRIGTVSRLTNAGGEKTLTILGPWESDPERDVVSYESDLAQAMLGKVVGESVEISGETFEIAAIDIYDPEA